MPPLREVLSKSDGNNDDSLEVLKWSNCLTRESRGNSEFYYLEPDQLSQLVRRLQRTKGGLFKLTGLQGTGKTSAGMHLSQVLERTAYVKLDSVGSLRSSLERYFADVLPSRLLSCYYAELSFKIDEDAGLRRRVAKDHDRICRIDATGKQSLALSTLLRGNTVEEAGFLEAEWFSKYLTKAEKETILDETLMKLIMGLDTLVVDLPDYAINDRRNLSRDLNDLQHLWSNLLDSCGGNDQIPNIVLTAQKELLMGSQGITHYLLGKMSEVELPFMNASQILKIYYETFKTYEPFKEDALRWLATVSRGVCRRFLRYVSACLDDYLAGHEHAPIDLDSAKKSVPKETIQADLRQEMGAIFPKGEMKDKAASLLFHLYSEGERINQKDLAAATLISEMDVSRILRTLEPYGYFRRDTSDRGRMIRAVGVE